MGKHTIYDDYSYKGEWWISSEEDRKVSGILKISQAHGITLEIFGAFESGKTFVEESSHKGNESYSLINGFCDEGLVTLIDGFLISVNSTHYFDNDRISQISKFQFDMMLTGIHIKDLSELKFKELRVNFSNLEIWLNQNPFEFIYDDSMGIKTNEIETFKTYVRHIECQINSLYTVGHKDNLFDVVSLKYTPYIVFKPDEPRSLDWFMEVIRSFNHMLCIFMNANIFIISIEQNEIDSNINVYPTPLPNYNSSFKVGRHNSFVINPFSLGNNLSHVFHNWFSNQIMSSIYMYLGTINRSDMILEDKFLSYAKAIESIHRKISPNNKFIDEELYNKTIETMLMSVKDSIDKNLYNKLKDTLEYANEYGFQRRIKESINNLPDYLKPYILLGYKKVAEFANTVRQNRDYYTHFGNTPECLFTPHQFFGINRSLQLITLYLILNHIGVPDEVFQKAIEKEYRWLEALEYNKAQFIT